MEESLPICVLRVAQPEVLFAEGDGGEFGVGADGAQDDGLFDVITATGFDELDSHDGVVVEKAAGVGAVGTDAADYGREVDDDFGAMGFEEAVDKIGRASWRERHQI